ncbi:MAG: glycosyltransferase family 2 protein [Acidobacteria bacterium]|nr:glycosyltransferase family 2 protein [Acidobacteriota bacterium]
MSVELSVVLPVYNEEANVPEVYRRLVAVLEGAAVPFEIVFVDDGSRDRTWTLVRELAANDRQVRGLSFSRNFGHQMAFAAGLDAARGRCVVVMDADLQDPPELIPTLLAKHREGYEVVYAVRTRRAGESAFKRWTAAAFYRLLRRITQVEIPVDTGDFRLMGSQALAAFRKLPERHRFTRGLVAWLGFSQIGVPYERPARQAGESSYPLRKMLRFAGDGITSFSHVPLQVATWLGVVVASLSTAYLLLFGILRLASVRLPASTALIAVVLVVSGVQLVTIGLLGQYVGRIYDEVKRRPLYLVRESVGGPEAAP